MRLIDADALIPTIVNTVKESSNKAYKHGTHSFTEVLDLLAEQQDEIIDIIIDTPEIETDDCRPHGRYRIDGHHIRFECCDKVLAIFPNESDTYENLMSCPFCDAKMDGKENE